MFNQKIVIEGNLGKDADVKFTQSGITMTKLSVGVYDGKDKSTDKNKTQWFDVVCFNDVADGAGALNKGDRVVCIGKMNSNVSEKEGVKKTYWGLVAETVAKDMRVRKEQNNYNNAPKDDDIPF